MKRLNTALTNNKPLVIGARSSKLSLKQVEEVLDGLKYHNSSLQFKIKCSKTTGDIDQTTSLKSLGATNFFTDHLDQWLLDGFCDLCVHSAKDLPAQLADGLEIIAITECVNAEDVIVLKPGVKLEKLKNPVIATSSKNREQNVLKLLPKAQFVDIRGTVEKRIEKMLKSDLDGVVIAKVALIRLNLTHLNSCTLPGETAVGQGSLAIVAKKNREDLKKIFSSIDARKEKKSLYFGLDPSKYLTNGSVEHLPLIQTHFFPINKLWQGRFRLDRASHIILSSKEGVKYFFKYLQELEIDPLMLKSKSWIALGQGTAQALREKGIYVSYTAHLEQLEGLIELLEEIKSPKMQLLLPRSSLSRSTLVQYLQNHQIHHRVIDLYETRSILLKNKPDLKKYDEIVLTSPSCVKSFFENFSFLPKHLKVITQGSISKGYLKELLAVR